jgi:hypothetical protein
MRLTQICAVAVAPACATLPSAGTRVRAEEILLLQNKAASLKNSWVLIYAFACSGLFAARVVPENADDLGFKSAGAVDYQGDEEG